MNNPVTYIDPSGYYHSDVHTGLTKELIKHSWIVKIAFPDENPRRIAEHIARANEYVDESSNLDSLACRECHFINLQATYRHVREAIDIGTPFMFGATLHQVQDWYAHWNEGYDASGLGHGPDTGMRYTRTFYKKWKFFNSGSSKDAIVRLLQQKNPELNIASLTDDELIDLYLRRYPGDDIEYKKDLRGYYGFDPDLNIPGSKRDQAMKKDTQRWIIYFFAMMVDECDFDWSQPDDAAIRQLLVE